jgi:hypothetical protein
VAGVASRLFSVAADSITAAPSFNAHQPCAHGVRNGQLHLREAGQYNLHAYILENAELGAQSNCGAGHNYVHNQVVREVLGGNSGTAGVISSNPIVDTPYSHTYTLALTASWNASNLQVMAYITRSEVGGALSLNATNVSMFPVGIEEKNALQASLHVFPNPFNDALQVELAADASPSFVETNSLDSRVLAQLARVFVAEPLRFFGSGSLTAGT